MYERHDVAVRQATILDLDLLTPLFDAYRQFYRKPSDLGLARRFLGERFQHNQNDLFVRPETRRKRVGSLLLAAAASFGRAVGAVRLTLSTEVTNGAAQALYETEGWTRQTDFHVYNLALDPQKP
jgi:GNAT superfamily N-acetyltransferase